MTANVLAKTEIAERIMINKFNMSGAIFHFTVFALLADVVLRNRCSLSFASSIAINIVSPSEMRTTCLQLMQNRPGLECPDASLYKA